MQKKFLDTATKAVLDAMKTASRSVVHKAAEATGKIIGKKGVMRIKEMFNK